MTVAQSLAAYMQVLGVGTLGQDIFIGKAPSSNEVPDTIWWLIENGGAPVRRNKTGESMKSYQVLVYKRDRDYRQIQEDLFSLEEDLNCSGCVELDGFDAVDIEVNSFPIDDDLDSEDRKIGLLQVTITTYKEC